MTRIREEEERQRQVNKSGDGGGSPRVEVLRWEGFVEKVGFEPG